ncbi:MAG: hypothetical protein RR547_12475, partial [Raoultibacter sp.]
TRIQNGHQLPPDSEFAADCDFEIAKELQSAMERKLGNSINLAEAQVITASQVFSATRDPKTLSRFIDEETKTFVHVLRDAIERRYGNPMDVDMVVALESLSYQAIRRRRSKFPISLFNATPMKQRNLDWLMTLEDILHSNPQLARVPLFADDVARIAMLLYPYWSGGRGRTYQVVLVADASFEQAVYGVHCIEASIPFVHVVEVISGADITLLEKRVQEEGGVDFIIGFNPLESLLPVCQISSSIDEADLMRLVKFALELKEPWHGKPFEVSSRTLNQEFVQDIVQAVYWDLHNDGIVKTSLEDFSEQFSAHCAISTEHMTTALCLKKTSTTGMRVYDTPAFHMIQPLLSVTVLYIAEKDISSMSEIVRHFNTFISRKTQGEHTYSMPPKLIS